MPVTNVPNTSTPNTGRVDWNNSDNSVQAEIAADEAPLTTQKGAATWIHPDASVTTAKINTAAITAVKISHDNNRTKVIITLSKTASTAGYWTVASQVLSAAPRLS